MAGGERDQVGEALERHRVAVVDQLGDRLAQRRELSHGVRYANELLTNANDSGRADRGVSSYRLIWTGFSHARHG